MALDSQYDYIVVGGGTAGLVLANRLSEDPDVSVVVIEAGKHADGDPRVAIPAMFTALMGSEHDWAFATVPQAGLDGRRIGHNHGKMLGGCSSINALAIIPPSASDIDAWEKIGNVGWNWKNLEPYLRKPFSLTLPDEETSKHLNISWAEELVSDSSGGVKSSFAGVKEHPIGRAWVETFEGLGYPLTASPFSGHSIGPYNAASSINPETKTRSSSSTAYYLPAMNRPNLKVLLGTVVERILLDKNELGDELAAVGVQINQESAISTVHAKKEVILSAGAFNSPKVLELSGIGDPEILNLHGISVQVPNSYVGRNLQDHVLCSISFEAADGIPTGDDLMRKDPAAIQYAMDLYQNHKAGPFCSSGVTSFGYLPTVDFANSRDELHSTLKSLAESPVSHPLDSARADILSRLLENGDEGTAQYFIFLAQSSSAGGDTTAGLGSKPQPGNFISLVTALSHPLSTGSVHISSSDPAQPPTINHQYLSRPLDLDLHARHVRYLEKIAAAPPLSSLLKPDGRRNDPAAFINGDLERARAFVKRASSSNWHSVGTCAMAPKDMGGVVDGEFRVYGVSRLRVVDASVFPFVPQSNTQSLVYAIAERASDIIKDA